MSGRMAYNEAITETNNQQMLKVFVSNRYEDPNSMLAVSSVTANVSLSSSARVEAGFGDSDNFDGNLAPFSGGFVYEENPTISYVPLAGERYMRQIMSPLPLSVVMNITRSMPHPETAYNMLIASVNGIRNPAFLYDDQQVDPDFERFVSLITRLDRAHCLHWVGDTEQTGVMDLVIETAAPCDQPGVDLLNLLGIRERATPGTPVSLPVAPSRASRDPSVISLVTRNLWSLVDILSAAVQVPAEDATNGTATSFPKLGAVGEELEIRHTRSRPETAYVAVEHRDGWFYIDDSDFVTKRYFKLLNSLWSAAMANSLGTSQSAPVLTVPVSG